MSILTKHYPEPYLVEYTFDVVSSRDNYKIPEDAWSDMVTKIEMKQPGQDYRYEVERAAYRDATKFRAGSRPNVPAYYIIRGREVELVPQPSGTYDGIMWYVRAPERLVLQKGRITLVKADTNTVNVDLVGSGITTEVDDLGSWVNIVDGQTGEIKATCQVKNISGTQVITFKSNIDAKHLTADGTILNRTPTTDLTTVTDSNGNLAIHPNDYICSIQGTCVPYFFQPARNFIISHAAADCGRAIGVPSDSMYREREKFEKEIRSSWVGREAGLRVKNNSPHWQANRNIGRRR